MASASVVDECVTKQVGYLPDEIANKYAGVELAVRVEAGDRIVREHITLNRIKIRNS
jgi:hypothetical protein